MTLFQRSLLSLLGAALAIGVWMFRYEMVIEGRVPYVLDRWTGKVKPVVPDMSDFH